MSLILPPDVTEASLERTLDDLRAVVGADHVLTSPEEMREFRDPFWHLAWNDYEAAAVVQPETVEEIQAIVRIANERRVPLWTSSQGRNNGYGGSSPRVRGSVVVNLRRMNRVLEIDPELGFAEVEPGVRWFDLYEAIQQGGHDLMLSCADLGWGSVIGNSLDHGCTYLPYGVDFGAPCGMEVVLANGELMRTGMGAMPGNRAWHVYKRGLGPTADQLFMQSNYGIVTKMGVWLMPSPECYMPIWVRGWKRRRRRPDARHAAPALDGRDDPDGPADREHADLRVVPDAAHAVVGRRRADPRRADRSHRARARGRPLADARRALRRRAGRRAPLREGQGGVRGDPRRRGVGHEDDAARGGGDGAPGRAHPGRRARPRHELHDRLVRRRGGGRPRRLLAGRADDRSRRAEGPRPDAQPDRGARPTSITSARCSRSTRAASCTSRW